MERKQRDITGNIMPRFNLIERPHPLRRMGHAVLWFLNMHQLSTHGDHTFERNRGAAPMLDDALEPGAPYYYPEDKAR